MRHSSILCLLLLATAGCSGQYSQRLEETNKLLIKSEPFRRDLLPESSRSYLQDVGLAIRLPKLLDANNKPIENNGAATTLKKIDGAGAERMSRVRPAALNSAQNFNVGTADAYDAVFVTKDKQAVYGGMYTVSIDAKQAKPETIPGLVSVLLKAGGITASWQDRQVETPAGATIPYKHLTYQGKMRFLSDVNATNAAAFVDAPGRVDLYLIADELRTLIVGWILPADASVRAQENPPVFTPLNSDVFFNTVSLAMGTAQFSTPVEPAAAPAPGPANPMNPQPGVNPPVAPQPGVNPPVAPQPGPVAPQPGAPPFVPQPGPVAPQPGAVAPQPGPVVPQPGANPPPVPGR